MVVRPWRQRQKTKRQALHFLYKPSPILSPSPMPPLPERSPDKLHLGTLEAEILEILWEVGRASARDIHQRILADPDRELAYASVMTVLRRLAGKGWIACTRERRLCWWEPRLTRQEAQMWLAHDRLHRFLDVGNPDIVAAFADSLDRASIEQLEAIVQRVRHARHLRSQAQPAAQPAMDGNTASDRVEETP